MAGPFLRMSLKRVILAGIIPILLVVPLFERRNLFLLNVLIIAIYYAYLSGAWNILAGYTGQLSFGHSAFVGIGAYSVAMLYAYYGISPWIGMIIGAAISAVASLGIGLPSLRLKKHYFILITLAFGQIVWVTSLNMSWLVGGAAGIAYKLLDFSWAGLQFNSERIVYYYIILLMLGLSLIFTRSLMNSKQGFYLMAVREDEIAAAICGIDVTKCKIASAMLSSVLTSFGGSFYAQYVLFIDPNSVFSLDVMTKIMLPTAIGGQGTLLGPLIGAVIIVPIGQFVTAYLGQIQGLDLIIYGLILVVVYYAMPAGIVGTLLKFSKRLRSPKAQTGL